MTLRNKISLAFAMVTALMLFTISISIYLFSATYTEDQFANRLRERVNIAVQFYVEAGELEARVLEEVRQQHLQLLPNEHEYVYPLQGSDILAESPDSVKRRFGELFLKAVYSEGEARWKGRQEAAVGILHVKDGEFHVLIVSATDEFGEELLKNLRTKMLIVFVVFLGFVLFISRLFAQQMLKPIASIIREVNQIKSTSMHLRLDEGNGSDELAQIAITFNQMLDRIETAIEIQHNFISNASHEIKNPLTAILGEIEITLSKERTVDEYQKSLELISNEAERLEALSLHLLRLAQTSFDDGELRRDEVRVDELLFDIKHELESANPQNRILLLVGNFPDNPDDLTISGNEGLMKIAMSNIIENGCKFSGYKPVDVALRRDESSLTVLIRDRGVGIPETEMKYIFDPFYRATNARKFYGFGIGLPLTQKIMKLHGGRIEVESVQDTGTFVKLVFPA